MPVAPPVSTTSGDGEDGETPERKRRLLLVLGSLGVVSAVIAALVIFSTGRATGPARSPVAQVRARGHSLVLGVASAPTKVVVFDDFGSPRSRTFEISSRDFLREEAAQGVVVVEYRPVTLLGEGYSTGALAAWGAVMEHGRASQALALHDLLYDRQPSPGQAAREFIALAREAGVKDGAVLDAVGAPDQSWVESSKKAAAASGVRTTPSVRVDGEPLSARSPVALADTLQRTILKPSTA